MSSPVHSLSPTDPLRPFFVDERGLHVLDQRALPHEERWLSFRADHDGLEGVANAIETLAVRGAPAIGGCAAAAVGVLAGAGATRDVLVGAIARLRRTRPTAVNLFFALDAVSAALDSGNDAVVRAAATVIADDARACQAMGDAGAALLNDGDVVITICHTGAVATCGQGTALGVVKSARVAGKDVAVVALETRPLWQGARLTAWECQRAGIPVTLITDGMAAFALARGVVVGGAHRRIRRAFVGADRVARNGDAANKIGTYNLAVACAAHGVPFHVVAPSSTFDEACPDGDRIPIEERGADEVRTPRGLAVAPRDVPVWNPAFDVTPARMIASWVTEAGARQLVDGRVVPR